jgi:hypothetical protein
LATKDDAVSASTASTSGTPAVPGIQRSGRRGVPRAGRRDATHPPRQPRSAVLRKASPRPNSRIRRCARTRVTTVLVRRRHAPPPGRTGCQRVVGNAADRDGDLAGSCMAAR